MAARARGVSADPPTWVSDACHIDGLIDAPGQPSNVDGTGRGHGARCDRREGECTGGPCPPIVDRDGSFQPLS
eukprot:1331985-Prymnesium_polylepis.1